MDFTAFDQKSIWSSCGKGEKCRRLWKKYLSKVVLKQKNHTDANIAHHVVEYNQLQWNYTVHKHRWEIEVTTADL